jgi:hypothetical protein
MKWLEFIKVRTNKTRKQSFYTNLLNDAALSREVPGLVKAKLYVHATLPEDLSICLTWNTAQPKAEGSELGIGLVYELRKSGLVDHTIWIEWCSCLYEA